MASSVVSWRFTFGHPAHALAMGFGAGLSPMAPGTMGTLLAWVTFNYWGIGLTDHMMLIALTLAGLIGWWACTVTAKHLSQADPSAIVWDEILAFWFILWVASPHGWMEQLLVFALFRYFDAAKPGPVRWADQVLKGDGWRGGLGILLDDLVAALCTLLTFALWRFGST